MRDDIEIQRDFYRDICSCLHEDLQKLLHYLPKSKRGSNVQRMLDQMQIRLDAAQEEMSEQSDA
ncbi:hypothetical protein Gdia_2499 [Gluconacetobacter diazotrophicus PA1 5]|uniref:hypothetical protein n=1 Tax=Gluconacetobacter diazotrophicus TaxID=33996 RepID=UPI000173DACA|nr:hypothetical protein [Gluconacetobacter diazotrophicus]ACI52243.1 hypothetical protein Gdia_2499 [Gluconacetobacter diazotrophicus PA1 5]TWB00405.1 hypothetical protein FBZ86_13719 [Gluconacetobacter diazotrophicus]